MIENSYYEKTFQPRANYIREQKKKEKAQPRRMFMLVYYIISKHFYFFPKKLKKLTKNQQKIKKVKPFEIEKIINQIEKKKISEKKKD